jgi:hypothetical protein
MKNLISTRPLPENLVVQDAQLFFVVLPLRGARDAVGHDDARVVFFGVLRVMELEIVLCLTDSTISVPDLV